MWCGRWSVLGAPVVVEDDRLTELVGRKDAVLAIKDRSSITTGKLGERLRQAGPALRRQAIGLIQQIELAPESAVMDDGGSGDRRLRKTQRRQVTPQPSYRSIGCAACGRRNGANAASGSARRRRNAALLHRVRPALAAVLQVLRALRRAGRIGVADASPAHLGGTVSSLQQAALGEAAGFP